MNRRGFLRGILAAGVAPAIVRIESLMPLVADDAWGAMPLIDLRQDAMNRLRTWSAAMFAETLKTPHLNRYLADRAFYEGEKWQSPIIRVDAPILNSLPPFEQPTPSGRKRGCDVPELRSKGLFIS